MPHRPIETEEHLSALVVLFRSLKKPFTVEWRLGRDRTLDQNALQWLWAGEVAEQLGDCTVGQVQARWKLHHGVPILRADSVKFREVYDRLLMPLSYEEKIDAMENLGIGVTSAMGVKQMTRYLDAVQRECIENGLRITDPELH